MLKLAIETGEAPFFSAFNKFPNSPSWVDQFGVYHLEVRKDALVVVKPEYKQVGVAYINPRDTFKVFCPASLTADFVLQVWSNCEKLRNSLVSYQPQSQLSPFLLSSLFKECNLASSEPDFISGGYSVRSYLVENEIKMFVQPYCFALQIFEPSGKLADTYKQAVPNGVDYPSAREFLLNCLNGFIYQTRYELKLSTKKEKLEELIR